MKKHFFAKLFVVTIVVMLFAALLATPSSAAVTDPTTLKPGSNAVCFIMDAPEGGELPGDGTGRDAQNPLKPIDHDGFDPNTEPAKLRQDLQTAFFQATELLKDTGGTVVICGPVLLGPNQTYGTTAATTRDVYTAKHATNTIKFTSVYNGIDYRETNGAKITLETPAEIGVDGQSIWENIDIETVGTNRIISFHHYATLIGEGVNCYPREKLYENVPGYYVSLSGGHRYSGGVDKTPTLVVQSGTYNVICSGVWGVNTSRVYNDDGTIRNSNNNDGQTVAKVVLEGTTKVLGLIIGTTKQKAEFSGNTEIVIKGGTYSCDIYGTGETGMISDDGLVTFRISGGDFTDAWGILPIIPGHANNAPAAAVIDFSGWTGDKTGLASIYNLAKISEVAFTNILLPEGVTEAELEALAEQTTPPSADDATTAPNVNNNGVLVFGEDETDASVDVGDTSVDVVDKGGVNIGLIIGIVVGAIVLVGAAIVVGIVVGKKASKK